LLTSEESARETIFFFFDHSKDRRRATFEGTSAGPFIVGLLVVVLANDDNGSKPARLLRQLRQYLHRVHQRGGEQYPGFDPEGSYQGILTKPEFSEWKRFLRSECSEVTQPPERIVFVTSGLYSGDLLAEASALEGKGKPFRGESGLEAGDYICQYHAKKGGLQGTYTAWLSDSLEDAKDRVTQGTLPYFRPDGIKVADHFADILDCPSGTFPAEDCLDAVISIDENGEPLPAAVEVWTGTRHTGVSYNADNCDGWTDGTSPKIGRVGSVFYDDEYWTSLQPRSCDKTRHLYCFEN
jgi:hypothetical protein